MSKKLMRYVLAMWFVLGATCTTAVLGDDALSKASAAVATILFDYEGDEFASYVISDSGRVEINFASNTPDPLYSEILNKLKIHPDVKGVLPGKSGPVCSRF
jgi:hypothetical protein